MNKLIENLIIDYLKKEHKITLISLKELTFPHFCLVNGKNNEKNFNKWYSIRRIESSFSKWSEIIRFRHRAQV